MNLSYCTNNLIGDATLTITGTWAEDAEFPKENLCNRRMSKRAGFDTAKAGEIVSDLGSAKTADSIALMNHNLTSGATVTIQANTSASWGAPPFSEAVSLQELDMHLIFTAAQTYRYWRTVVSDPGRADADIRIGELILGKLTELDRNYDWDLKKKQSYSNIMHETAGGNYWAYALFDRKAWTMKFSTLSTSQLAQIKTLIDAVHGNAYPFLAIIEEAPYYIRIQDTLATSRPMQVPDLEFWGEDFFPIEYMIDSLTLTEETRGI